LEDIDETPQFAEDSLSPDKILKQHSNDVVIPKKEAKQHFKIEEKPMPKADIKKFIQQKQNEAKQNRKLYTADEVRTMISNNFRKRKKEQQGFNLKSMFLQKNLRKEFCNKSKSFRKR
jgi:hypothetical protein